MHWEPLTGRTGILKTDYALIPIYRLNDRELVMVDSGAERHPEWLAEFDQEGLRVRAVLTTHLHPDHIANNHDLISHYGTEIYADDGEIAGIHAWYQRLNTPKVDERWAPSEPDYPMLPYGAQEELHLDGQIFRLLRTPGHTAGHRCILTPDGVCCLGDVIMSLPILKRSKLPMMDYDVDQAIESMERILELSTPLFVASHRAVITREALADHVRENIRVEIAIYDRLRKSISAPCSVESAITAFLRNIGIQREMLYNSWNMRNSVRIRMDALVRAEELQYLPEGRIGPV